MVRIKNVSGEIENFLCDIHIHVSLLFEFNQSTIYVLNFLIYFLFYSCKIVVRNNSGKQLIFCHLSFDLKRGSLVHTLFSFIFVRLAPLIKDNLRLANYPVDEGAVEFKRFELIGHHIF
ncbi:MAG: hypothetical protein A2836_00650 [Candidatus Taylorbacteria bacterium RIFCSPHIGHO2_01_FULL_45_63]|uniref:Uncharacterized protein n=1 Tax=Candidatus Taylorbacteria bacterium RIFCSPHIGHO2_02_FULL_45_35 TaxID=1802311 RepID=A0A1G2MV25_9BACT|nr:MAG: hypothetical protein A2836_00650 [Candidatus Taylorbacteria bacterium RIFCSPHIGHO2_01_FULL_45_63]OHA27129.1 MAG: hypothetical protein A3D56_03350 [Candidatus Taylorbacteria bacterium RIFCSPHIGHO2_02_FULL_45_35]